MGEVEVAMEEVLELLPGANEADLERMVTALALQVKEPKAGKAVSRKSVLLNTIRRYISSEDLESEDDEDLEILSRMHTMLEAQLAEKKKHLQEQEKKELENIPTPEKEMIQEDVESKLAEIKRQVRDEVENSGGSEDRERMLLEDALRDIRLRDGWMGTSEARSTPEVAIPQTLMKPEENLLIELLKKKAALEKDLERETKKPVSTMDFHKFKLKEFKINGTIGGENEIEYSSLMYQVKEGKTLGYNEKEIQLGIVKGVKDKTLKKFFEINSDLTDEEFYGMIRNHYDVKDSTTLLEEMVTSVQEPKEDIDKFYPETICPFSTGWFKKSYKPS